MNLSEEQKKYIKLYVRRAIEKAKSDQMMNDRNLLNCTKAEDLTELEKRTDYDTNKTTEDCLAEIYYIAEEMI